MSSPPVSDGHKDLIKYYRYLNKLLTECSDPIRVRIVLLLFTYPRLTRSQFSTLLNRSKPAITYQLNQLKNLDLIRVTEEVGDQGHKVKYYHFGPEIWARTRFIPWGMEDHSHEKLDPKEFQELEARSISSLFQFTRIVMEMTSNFYEDYETRIHDTNQRFEVPSPFFEYSVHNLTKEEWKYYQTRIDALNREIDEKIAQRYEAGTYGNQERPYLACNLTVPLKQVLECEKNQP